MKPEYERVIRDLETRRTNYDLENTVAIANDMIKGTSKLSLPELKLLRLLIMQIRPDDKDFYSFDMRIKDLGETLGISPKNLHRDIQQMTRHLLSEVIMIGDGNPKHKWKMFQWLSSCQYENGIITIKLHDNLKPYLIGLQKWYTQYSLEEIQSFSSVYTIRLYELITWALKGARPYADNIQQVYIDIETIRRATDTMNKYEKFGMFKKRVIETPLKEINENAATYFVTCRDYKEGHKVVGFYFTVESQAGHNYRTGSGKQLTLQEWEIENQIETVEG